MLIRMKEIKIAYIGTYPPYQCGIATFTRDLRDALSAGAAGSSIKINSSVIAVSGSVQDDDPPLPEAAFFISKELQKDYIEAAKFIDNSDIDICILQHEYGIFGGDSGTFILSLVRQLKIPLIVTFHTVLKNPSSVQKLILHELGKKAEKIVVMGHKAIDFLTTIYQLPAEKIKLIEHGVPSLKRTQNSRYKNCRIDRNLEGKKILFTFGLLSRNKGIETVIRALPKLVLKHPDVIYILLGKTHPNIIKNSGEEYRNYLKELVGKNNLEKYVIFDDRYVSNEELFDCLSTADIYIAPGVSEEQITSGTLSYAIGAGAAVVSTPYWHAQEILAGGRGKLFDSNDANGLAEILIQLLDNPSELERLRERANSYGQETTWPKIGCRYLELVLQSKTQKVYPGTGRNSPIDPETLPSFNLGHIKGLTDNTGILQHTKYGIPNFKEGYCLDDNARALLMSAVAYRQKKEQGVSGLIPVYLSFIHYMQNEDGTFKNFLTYSRQFKKEKGSDDSFGRAVWALGYLQRFPPKDAYQQLAREMFTKAFPHFEKITSLRGVAFTIIGICHYLHRFPNDEGMKRVLRQITEKIVHQYELEKDGDWHWFEPKMTYANGMIPLSLLHSVEIIKDKKTLRAAQESMTFLERTVFREGVLSLVGNENWYDKGGTPSQFAQQPIDAMAMVLMNYQAYRVTKDPVYIQRMHAYFMWFLGENDLGIPLYDPETGGCFDSLESYGLNQNQGAESTLAYLISHLTILLAHEAYE